MKKRTSYVLAFAGLALPGLCSAQGTIECAPNEERISIPEVINPTESRAVKWKASSRPRHLRLVADAAGESERNDIFRAMLLVTAMDERACIGEAHGPNNKFNAGCKSKGEPILVPPNQPVSVGVHAVLTESVRKWTVSVTGCLSSAPYMRKSKLKP